ncbi:uncharacterized protein LOC111022366 [Momordica charantia]|uniref:Uncharacterized protein LOC111022366 n=1 Tax=Momordica charantia TaxID=3673 RepID=A0A6J1DPM2_MOMCH|nr:uncharacterized protein LOC111022366 [Momordica charantia]
MRNLERQVGQLANDLKARPQGSIPGHTEVPKRYGKEQCKAVTLRSGLSYEGPKMLVEVKKPSTSIQNAPSEAKKEKTTSGEGEASGSSPQKKSSFAPIPPFPQRLAMKNQETQFRKFLDILKQLHINIPLVDALEQMLNYAMFQNDIVSRKKKLGELEMIAMTKCSSEAVELGIGEARPTTVTLQLADRPIKKPEGKMEDVLVQILTKYKKAIG